MTTQSDGTGQEQASWIPSHMKPLVFAEDGLSSIRCVEVGGVNVASTLLPEINYSTAMTWIDYTFRLTDILPTGLLVADSRQNGRPLTEARLMFAANSIATAHEHVLGEMFKEVCDQTFISVEPRVVGMHTTPQMSSKPQLTSEGNLHFRTVFEIASRLRIAPHGTESVKPFLRERLTKKVSTDILNVVSEVGHRRSFMARQTMQTAGSTLINDESLRIDQRVKEFSHVLYANVTSAEERAEITRRNPELSSLIRTGRSYNSPTLFREIEALISTLNESGAEVQATQCSETLRAIKMTMNDRNLLFGQSIAS